MESSVSLTLARTFLGKEVELEFDQPLGSMRNDGVEQEEPYPVNYGYVPGTIAPDGEALDAYLLNETRSLKKGSGICIAIVHRRDDDDDKLVVVPELTEMSDEDIMKQVYFQEQYFDSVIVRE